MVNNTSDSEANNALLFVEAPPAVTKENSMDSAETATTPGSTGVGSSAATADSISEDPTTTTMMLGGDLEKGEDSNDGNAAVLETIAAAAGRPDRPPMPRPKSFDGGNLSPRSSMQGEETMNNFNQNNHSSGQQALPETISSGLPTPPPPGRKSRKNHRRANSEGIPRTVPVPTGAHHLHHQQQFQHQQYGMRHNSMGGYGMHPYSPQMNYPVISTMAAEGGPQLPGAGGRRKSNRHNRSRTWSDHGVPPGPGPMPPPSPRGTALPGLPRPDGGGGGYGFGGSERFLQQETILGRPGVSSTSSLGRSSSRRHGNRRRGAHRRAASSSEAMPGIGYGSFWEPPDQQQAGPGNPNFSPRGEFLSLTSSLRGGVVADGGAAPQSPYRTAQDNLQTAKWSPAGSAPLVPHSSSFEDPASSSSMGGEAVYMLQKRRKPESTRKMHMRQQSAQLYMEDVKGEEQPPACRDVIFLLLFVFHLVFMVYLGNMYGYKALRGKYEVSDEQVTIDYKSLVYVSCLAGAFAVVLSATLLAVMTIFPRRFVQVSLIVAITLSFVWGTVGIGVSPKNVVPITGIIALALSVAYAFIVWDRIPFAAANLHSALSGVRDHPGTIVIAFVFQALALIWSIYYGIVVCGVYDAIQENDLKLNHHVTVLVYVLLGVSYYWTFQVLQNTVQAATAQVIRKWWYGPGEEPVVKRSAFHTIFYCMGSICFGSLLVGPVRIVRQFSVLFRPTSDEASLLCLHECLHCLQTCITRCVDRLSDNFNPWAFTYIGLYGYPFMEAGHRATETFDKRGWKTIVSDDLVPNILLMTSLVIGGVTGCFALMMTKFEALDVLVVDEADLASFAVGLVIGLVLTSVLFGVISSSMNAVIVCFATSPVDFEQNHPELSHEMRAAWREVWPGALDAIDARLAMGGVALAGPPGPMMAGLGGSEHHPLLAPSPHVM